MSIEKEILSFFTQEQKNKVFIENKIYCIDESFIGFMQNYKALSEIIPKNFTVIDLGCAYMAQSYFFRNHNKFIGVDIFENNVFQTKNSEFFSCGIDIFIDKHLEKINLDKTFAILSYVPCSKKTQERVRETFSQLFCFYPYTDDEHKVMARSVVGVE